MSTSRNLSWLEKVDFAKGSVTVSLTKSLGKGSFGCVYLGEYKKNDDQDSHTIAIKYCEKSNDGDYVAMHALQAKQQSPYLIKLIDHKDMGAAGAVLALEYMEKGSVGKFIQEPSYCDWNTRFQISEDCISGLSDMHGMGYLHRDIKIENVLLNNNLRAKLCDFGFSVEEAKVHHERVGSPVYMAPEIWTSSRAKGIAYSQKSDIYAFGLFLLEVATCNKQQSDKIILRDVRICTDLFFVNWSARLKMFGQLIDAISPTDISKLIQDCIQLKRENRPTAGNIQERLTTMSKIHGEVRQVFFASTSAKKSDDIAGLVREYAAEDSNAISMKP